MVLDRRNGIYRGVVIAAFGWLSLVGAKIPNSDSAKAQRPSHGEVAAKIEPALPPIKPTLSADNATADCGPNQYKSNDDLCAQWKAADAAKSAALSAWVLGSLGLLVGLATLSAAIMAAVYARNAATETKRGADAAEKAVNASSESLALQMSSDRPVMVFDPKRCKVRGWPFEEPWTDPALMNNLQIEWYFENVGQQPCWIVSAWFTFFMQKFDDRGLLHIPDELPDWFRVGTAGFIRSGQGFAGTGGLYGINPHEREILEKGGGLIVFGMCQYRTLNQRIFATRFAYQVPVSIGNVTSGGDPIPFDNVNHWRDGLVASAKLVHEDSITWL